MLEVADRPPSFYIFLYFIGLPSSCDSAHNPLSWRVRADLRALLSQLIAPEST